MAKFNKESEGLGTIENYMGAKSFKQVPKEELAFSVLSTFIEDSYYESKDDRIKRISKLVKEVAEKDPSFIAKLAVITRKEFHMRSAFHVLVAELSRCHRGDSLIKNLMSQGVERVDDITEIFSYLGKPIPNQVKKGAALALNKFKTYNLAKYRGATKQVKLVDVLNLIHPVPSKDNEKAFKELVEGTLRSRNTWESKLTETGKQAKSEEEKVELKKEAWGDLIAQKEMGYMAILRNLRNMLEQADSDTVKKACEFIADKENVKKSKQLPFRFLSALAALEDSVSEKVLPFEKDFDRVTEVQKAVITALEHSIENIPLLEGKTVILTDNSGSMRGDCGGHSLVSAYSKRTSADIANLFAVLYWKRADNTLVGLFGDRLIIPKLNRSENIYANFKKIDKEAETCGGGTETGIFTIFKKLIDTKEIVDRIVIFSDCQVGTGCQWYDTGRNRGEDFNKLYHEYLKISPKTRIYCVDLRGYGNKMFSDNVVLLSGWSDKIYELMEVTEKKEGLVKYIENYSLEFKV
jgi:60 kDa SS-A/Ro ribonucleoprotein